MFDSIVSATLKVTPIEQRQIGICLMEMAIYVAELFILPYGFVTAVLTFSYFSILFQNEHYQ